MAKKKTTKKKDKPKTPNRGPKGDWEATRHVRQSQEKGHDFGTASHQPRRGGDWEAHLEHAQGRHDRQQGQDQRPKAEQSRRAKPKPKPKPKHKKTDIILQPGHSSRASQRGPKRGQH